MKKTYIKRVGDKWFYVDVINTSAGNIRIGSMPEISKWLAKEKIDTNYVILPPPITTQAGDNYTGEEFVFWYKIYNNDFSPITYMGEKNNVIYLYKRLKRTVNSTFNKNKTKIIRVKRVQRIFRKKYLKLNTPINITDKIKVVLTPDNIIIYENDTKIYEWINSQNFVGINKKVNKYLASYKKNRKYIKHLEIIAIGNGNGFRGNTSNFIIRYADRAIWIDVMAKPFLALKKIKLHWDNITDYFISHIHEDHIEGLSAVLKRASDTGKSVNIITTKKIMKELKKIYKFLFPDFDSIVNHINIIPNASLPYYHGYLTVRLNHHVLPSGTLSLKVQFKNNIFALSGDTKYDSNLASKTKNNPAFDISWYNDCHLVFHEVEFENPDNVHTYYKEIQNIMKKINGKVLVYHSSSEKFLLDGVREYTRYIIKEGKVIIKKV